MIRKFYLENKNGEIYNFDYYTGTLISNIDGLGIDHELVYLKYDNLYEQVQRNLAITDIKATLTFLKGYIGYSKFLDYLKEGNSLKLYYDSGDKKYCNVDVKSVSKSELVFGVLQCDIVFNKLSPWLKEKVVSIVANGDNVGKVYPYTYLYSYSKSYEGKVTLSNNGTFKSPINAVIYGSVMNPEINIYKDEVLVSRLRLFVESNDAIITVSSNPINQYIDILVNGNKHNIYDKQDFTCDNFLFINPGEYVIEFKPGVSSITNCTIKLMEGYIGN